MNDLLDDLNKDEIAWLISAARQKADDDARWAMANQDDPVSVREAMRGQRVASLLWARWQRKIA